MKTYPPYEESLQSCDDEVENANYHNFYGLAEEIFDAMRPFIQEKDFDKVAHEIADRIMRKI